MIIEDIHGNIITNPDLDKGHLEKAQRDGNTIYIYFPFTTEEQEAYDYENHASKQARADIDYIAMETGVDLDS